MLLHSMIACGTFGDATREVTTLQICVTDHFEQNQISLIKQGRQQKRIILNQQAYRQGSHISSGCCITYIDDFTVDADIYKHTCVKRSVADY